MTLSNIALVMTFALAVATLWLAANRFSMRLESNWPLIYYALLVVHANASPGLLNPYLLYVAVICGLLLRFEFLNARIILFVRIVELVCFANISWILLRVLYEEFG